MSDRRKAAKKKNTLINLALIIRNNALQGFSIESLLQSAAGPDISVKCSFTAPCLFPACEIEGVERASQAPTEAI